MNDYEPDPVRRQNQQLSFQGFVSYMNDEKQFILMDEKTKKVYQRMDLPIFCYFVNSSHNTFEFFVVEIEKSFEMDSFVI